MADTRFPDMLRIQATDIAVPPTWATLQRQLIDLMEQAAPIMSQKYADGGGTWYWSDDMDDYLRAHVQLVPAVRHGRRRASCRFGVEALERDDAFV